MTTVNTQLKPNRLSSNLASGVLAGCARRVLNQEREAASPGATAIRGYYHPGVPKQAANSCREQRQIGIATNQAVDVISLYGITQGPHASGAHSPPAA